MRYYTFVHKSKLELAALEAQINTVETVGKLKSILATNFRTTAKDSRYRPVYSEDEFRYLHTILPIYTLILWRITVEKRSKIQQYYIDMGFSLSRRVILGITLGGVQLVTNYDELCRVSAHWDIYRPSIMTSIDGLGRLADIIGAAPIPFNIGDVMITPLCFLSKDLSKCNIDLATATTILKELEAAPSLTLWNELYTAALEAIPTDIVCSGHKLTRLEAQVLNDLAKHVKER